MTVDDNDPRLERCAFAKLQSVDGTFEYFIRKYEIVLGRTSKHADVELGENSNISRKHAVITYNFNKGAFELTVLSKNGVTVEGTLCSPESGPVTLHSQDTISVADQTFYFLLPKDVRRAMAERMAAAAQPQPVQPPQAASMPPPMPSTMQAPSMTPTAAALPTPVQPMAWTAASQLQQISPAALAALAAAQQQQQQQQQQQMIAAQQQMLAAQQQQAMLAAMQQQQAPGVALNGGGGNVANLFANVFAQQQQQQQQPPPPS